jgi:amidophosphoribosyltransferase
MKEYCGIFGVYGHPEAVQLTYLGLYALQHRGQESAGIVSKVGDELHCYKGMGIVGDVFKAENLNALKSHTAIGHVRYSTAGSSVSKNAQPILIDYSRGQIAIGHNGNLVNANSLRRQLELAGSIFQTTTDSEVILHLIARHNEGRIEDAILGAIKQIKGAFSLTILTENQLIGIRDPNGFRPLCIGSLEGAHVLASETCALDLIGADFLREVEPGEMVIINKYGLRSIKYAEAKQAFCIFEFIYFSRPDSNYLGQNVHQVRKRLGAALAKEHPVKADLVMPIPDSGNSAALGFADGSGIPFEIGITRNHYIGRTFIQPSEFIRDFGVRIKLNPIKKVLEGKKVVIVDDSIVRGTTSRSRIRTIREAGAREVHMRTSCPPHKFPCVYGIDFPSQSELIAANYTVSEIASFLQADSLGYLSVEGMLENTGVDKNKFCTACFTGEYCVAFEEAGKYLTERRRK